MICNKCKSVVIGRHHQMRAIARVFPDPPFNCEKSASAIIFMHPRGQCDACADAVWNARLIPLLMTRPGYAVSGRAKRAGWF